MAVEPASQPAVEIAIRDSFVLARLCLPPANPVGPALLDGLDAAADAVVRTGAGTLVICSAVEGFFAAGADIKHMRSLDPTGFAAYGMHMRRVYDRIESLSAVSIAASMIAGAKFKLIANSGHSAYFEQPAAFNQALLEFFAALA